jgi:hypothetical protein
MFRQPPLLHTGWTGYFRTNPHVPLESLPVGRQARILHCNKIGEEPKISNKMLMNFEAFLGRNVACFASEASFILYPDCLILDT